MKNKKDMHEHEMNDNVDSNDFSTNEAGELINKDEPDTANDSEAGNEEIAKLKSDLDEQKDKYVRLFAEFDNYRRRTSKEQIELRQTAGVEIITSLLEVLDDIDRAENQLQESNAEVTLKEGITLVFNKFRRILQSKGLKPIETLHSDFDVEKDEAISEIEVDDKKLKGKVVAEVQKGYLLNDKLIRFAKVVVGK
jgi:molecular chaperone GrpE